MNVVFISSEAAPYSKTGGLGDVVGALPAALGRLGVDVSVFSPLYPSAKAHAVDPEPQLITVPMGPRSEWGAIRREGRFFFVEHELFFNRPGLYGNGRGEYADNLSRFVFLMRGALEYLAHAGPAPDVIHVHDWQTALVPLYVKELYARAFPRTKTVFTVHNLAYQGKFWKEQLPLTGIGWDHFNFRDLEYFDGINLMKAGLVHADALTTVSPTYAHEIQHPAHGDGLDGVLRERAPHLRGILNGVDYEEWEPQRDPHLAAAYGPGSLGGKRTCKAALQRRCGFPLRPEVPVLCMVGRLAEQKGIELFARSAEGLLALDLQIVILGTGEAWLEEAVRRIAEGHPRKVSAQFAFDNASAHQIIAGSDLLLVPSRYEPCGLTQLYALRYGTVPVVRSTGGLVDTVQDGITGFRFDDYTPESLQAGVTQATAAFRDPLRWRAIQTTGMARDFSWEASAREYLSLYRTLVGAD